MYTFDFGELHETEFNRAMNAHYIQFQFTLKQNNSCPGTMVTRLSNIF